MIGFPNTNSDLLNITLQQVEELQKENESVNDQVFKVKVLSPFSF